MNILNHLYRWDREQAAHDILQTYAAWKSVFVDFLYFATAMKMRLFENAENKEQELYKAALLDADILLPDGIALQLFDRLSRKGKKSWLHNLNWTDFTPYFFPYLLKKWTVSLYVCGVYDSLIWKDESRMYKGVENVQKIYPGLSVPFARQALYQKRGEEFPWEEFRAAWKQDTAEYKIFGTFMWSPFQEMRAYKNKDMLAETPCIFMQLGGTIDFWSGFEKRAPTRVVKARILETPRRIAKNPKKNRVKLRAMFGIRRYLRKKIRGEIH